MKNFYKKPKVQKPVVEAKTEEVKVEPKIELTDQEKEKLVYFKNLGNLTQADALEYHVLLNKEAEVK